MSDLAAEAGLGSPGGDLRALAVYDFAQSALFDRTFQDGMSLVEDTAAYLDGAGRQESRLLSKTAALAYASESMRLTTQLMEVASWLLVQRAVREGDMKAADAFQPRYRIDGKAAPGAAAARDPSAVLPSGLLSLADRARSLHERVVHLDRRMYRDELVDQEAHPVLSQMERLRAAFASG